MFTKKHKIAQKRSIKIIKTILIPCYRLGEIAKKVLLLTSTIPAIMLLRRTLQTVLNVIAISQIYYGRFKWHTTLREV